ncbi:MAG: transketolase family protein [Erysipelotrichaceae bacterium]|nr:transketolase family protein [Erysipelotrichaceae bacterium]
MAKATREAYGEEIARLVREDEKVVVLDADLAGSTQSIKGKNEDPERFFDMGIAEQDMVGTAAGFAASGFKPYISTFAMFSSGRAWEQIRNSVAYPQLNVKIIGSHGGISVGEDGVTHQALEDISIMRDMNGMSVFVPCDANETKAVIRYVHAHEWPCYIRLGRPKVDDVYEDADIDVTRVHVLKQGTGVAVFCCGLMVQSTLEAAKLLAEDGIHITVVDVCAIKPCDKEGIVKVLENHDTVFTVEEHSVTGGLGTMICEIAAEKCPRTVHRLGMYGFAGSGNWKTLLSEYHLDGEGIRSSIEAFVNEKNAG